MLKGSAGMLKGGIEMLKGSIRMLKRNIGLLKGSMLIMEEFTPTYGYLQGKSTLKLNSSANEKYEYGHLGCWYIKLTLFKRF